MLDEHTLAKLHKDTDLDEVVQKILGVLTTIDKTGVAATTDLDHWSRRSSP